MRIYTRRGDDGTTALRTGGRIAKSDERIALLGDVDEAQAALGLGRAECEAGGPLEEVLLRLERDLWLVMADLALPPERSDEAKVDAEMITQLEHEIDGLRDALELSPNFSVPGANRCSAALDFARTVVRRAERAAVALGVSGTLVAYLNRLSDLCWALARDAEDEHLVHGARFRRQVADDGEVEELEDKEER